MKIIKIPNFITDEERLTLINHAKENMYHERTVAVPAMENLQNYLKTDNLFELIDRSKNIMCVSVQETCNLLLDIEQRIKKIFESYINKDSKIGSPFVMVHFKNSELPIHKDPKKDISGGSSCFMNESNELIRANILLQKPELGGKFTVDPSGNGSDNQREIEFNECELLIFGAGQFYHQVTPTQGNINRLISICSIEAEPGTMDKLEIDEDYKPEYIKL